MQAIDYLWRSITPATSFTNFAQTIAVIPCTSLFGLYSTISEFQVERSATRKCFLVHKTQLQTTINANVTSQKIHNEILRTKGGKGTSSNNRSVEVVYDVEHLTS